MTNFTLDFKEDLKVIKVLENKINSTNDPKEIYGLITALKKQLTLMQDNINLVENNHLLFPLYIDSILSDIRKETKRGKKWI